MTRHGHRAIEIARAAWGAGTLLAPRFVLGRVHRIEIDERSLVIARVLGARHLTQALLSGLAPSPEVLAMGVWVDAVHSLTAVGLAGMDPARKRAGFADAAVAAAWAAFGYRDIVRVDGAASVRSENHERTRDRLARAVLGVVPVGTRLRAAAAQARDDAAAQRQLTNQEG